MKVRLLTYHFSDNYGALYQAYSLRQWFHSRGIDAEFINYHPSYVENGGQFDRPFNIRLFKKNSTIAYLKIISVYKNLFGNKEQKKGFDLFRSQYLGITNPAITDADHLVVSDDTDLLICGSDQIWCPSVQFGLDKVYFLDFPSANKARRISYAPSFGKATLDYNYHDQARRWISQLDAVSVREQSGVKIVKELTGYNATCVPDPTILLGDFSSLLTTPTDVAKLYPSNSYIFCYALRTDKIIRGVAEFVAKFYNLTLLSPRSPHQRWSDIGIGVTPGPIEWLQLMANSQFVVTNSFHGVALSIILNRPFLAVSLPGNKGAFSERINNLLSKTFLKERLVLSDDKTLITKICDDNIHWQKVNASLTEQRHVGEQFLNLQISLTEGDNH